MCEHKRARYYDGLCLDCGEPTNEARPKSPVLLGLPDGRAPERLHVPEAFEKCPICKKTACGHFNEPKP